MATPRQLRIYRLHRMACRALGHAQSTLKLRALEGAITANNAQKNQVYTGPGPRTALPPTTDILVWATWKAQELRGMSAEAGDTAADRAWVELAFGQFPVVDDSGALIAMGDENWLVDAQSVLWRVENPALSPDNSFWTCHMVRMR